MPLIPALGRQRQADLSDFQASLVYKVSSKTARTVTQRNPVSRNKTVVILEIFSSSPIPVTFSSFLVEMEIEPKASCVLGNGK